MIRKPLYNLPASFVVIILSILLSVNHAYADNPQTTKDNKTLQKAVEELKETVKQLRSKVDDINDNIKEITKEPKQQKDKNELEDRLKQREFRDFWEEEFLTLEAGFQWQYLWTSIHGEYDDIESLSQFVFGLGYHIPSSDTIAIQPYFQLQTSLFGWDDTSADESFESTTWSLGFRTGLRFDIVVCRQLKILAGFRFSFNYIEEDIRTRSELDPPEDSLDITKIIDLGVSVGFGFILSDNFFLNFRFFDFSFKPGYLQKDKILASLYVYIGVEFRI